MELGCYTIEFATFAIYFREVHKWDQARFATNFGTNLHQSTQSTNHLLPSSQATLASVAQTAGDIIAAVAMRMIPVRMMEGDPQELPCVKRFMWYLTAQPYNLSRLS